MKKESDIKVIGPDRMCFYVDSVTLEPRTCSFYDAWAFSDPENVPSMGFGAWSLRRSEMRDAAQRGDV